MAHRPGTISFVISSRQKAPKHGTGHLLVDGTVERVVRKATFAFNPGRRQEPPAHDVRSSQRNSAPDPVPLVVSAHRSGARVALVSIRPQFSTQILAGTKTVEFRKRRLADDVGVVVIYETAPTKAIVGAFEVAAQSSDTAARLWERFADVGGIDEAGFFDYFGNSGSGVAIHVGRVERFARAVALAELPDVTVPPQSFRYLPDATVAALAAEFSGGEALQ